MLYKNPYKDIPSGLRRGTYVFCDVANYTGFVSTHPPKEVIDKLNIYYNCVFQLAIKHQGRSIDVLGDGIGSLFWGRNHADHAFEYALELLKQENQIDCPFELKIGISTGNLGGKSMIKKNLVVYTLVGQGIIEACREEALSHNLHTKFIINEHTTKLLSAKNKEKIMKLTKTKLKGLKRRFNLYTLKDHSHSYLK